MINSCFVGTTEKIRKQNSTWCMKDQLKCIALENQVHCGCISCIEMVHYAGRVFPLNFPTECSILLTKTFRFADVPSSSATHRSSSPRSWFLTGVFRDDTFDASLGHFLTVDPFAFLVSSLAVVVVEP